MSILDVFKRRGPLLPDEWERDPEREARMQQLRDGERIEFDGETHWAPFKPLATRTPPTKPGFYAQRIIHGAYWTIVEVLPDSAGTLWWAHGPRDPAKRVEDNGLFEWSDRPYVLPRQ